MLFAVGGAVGAHMKIDLLTLTIPHLLPVHAEYCLRVAVFAVVSMATGCLQMLFDRYPPWSNTGSPDEQRRVMRPY